MQLRYRRNWCLRLGLNPVPPQTGSNGPSAGVSFCAKVSLITFLAMFVSCALFVNSERKASACFTMLSAKQGRHWYHF